MPAACFTSSTHFQLYHTIQKHLIQFKTKNIHSMTMSQSLQFYLFSHIQSNSFINNSHMYILPSKISVMSALYISVIERSKYNHMYKYEFVC